MVANIPIRWLAWCVLCTLLLPVAYAQDRRKSERSGPKGQQVGLVDFALSGVNPNNRNYGQCFGEARRILIQETVDRAYFWSNLCSIGVAGFLFVIVLYQRQFNRRSEQIASETITQYHHALERAESQAQIATTRNHELMKALSIAACREIADQTLPSTGDLMPQRRPVGRPPRDNSVPGVKSAQPPKAAEASQDTVQPPKASVPPQNTTPQPKVAAPSHNPTSPPAVTPAATSMSLKDQRSKPLNQMGLFGSEVELIAKINVLQQQLSSSQEREKHLRRQLNDSELRVQKEQQKARILQS